MPKRATLTTRSLSSSTATSEQIPKASGLTTGELDSNFLELRDQTFGVVGDDSATIDIAAGGTLYIQGGTNVTTSTNSDGSITINSTGGGAANTGTLSFTGNQIKTNADAATLLSTDSEDDFNTIKCSEIHIDIGDTSTPNSKFVFNGNGLTSNSGLNTLRLSAQEYGSDTSNDANIGQLYFKHIEYHNTNAYHSIGEEGDLVFRGNHDSGANANAGGHYPYIALREYADNGVIEIEPKPGKEVKIDGIDIKDNTIATNSSNANLEISANGSGKVQISGIKFPTSDGTNGQALVTDGSGQLTFSSVSGASLGDLTAVGSTLISPSNADLTLAPAGTGKVNISAAYTLPSSDGNSGEVLQTNGSGVLAFATASAINIDGGTAASTYGAITAIDGGDAT